MDVIRKKSKGVAIASLKSGAIFDYGGELYIKIDSRLSTTWNAVAIRTGNTAHFTDIHQLTIVHGSFVEEEPK